MPSFGSLFSGAANGWTYDLKRQGKQHGANFAKWTTWPNTFHCHRLLEFAFASGGSDLQHHVADKLFVSCYEEGKNVSLISTCIEAAKAAGMNEDQVKAYMESKQFVSHFVLCFHTTARDNAIVYCIVQGFTEVTAADRASKQQGIHGVPFFVINDQFSASGAQSPSWFLKCFEMCLISRSASSASSSSVS